MRYQVFNSNIQGKLKIIPSKSLTHRALICAALANGESTIENPLYANDTLQTLEILKHLGTAFLTHLDSIKVTGGTIRHSNEPLNARESGSTIRFLIPIALLTGEEEHFILSPSLAKRPQETYETLFLQKGITFEKVNSDIFVKGPILPGEYIVSGDISSQFISGLLFVLPLLNEDSEIVITGAYESKSYVDMTIKVMEQFGVKVKQHRNSIFIPGNQMYQNTHYLVENDYSQAAFFLTSAALKGEVTLTGLKKDSLQGDKKIIDYLEKFGAKVLIEPNQITVRSDQQKPLSIDISNNPDLGPILFVLGALSSVEVKIRGINRLRYKESDRIESMCQNLDQVGAKYKLNYNVITFYPSTLKGGALVSSFNDHRICMSMAILATHLEEGLIIDGVESVSKSYPNFFEDLLILGGKYASVESED
ncbi:MAG: 3-phosphoshikimate 1-carboxyvinyltransferase [Acholeplasmataceae bacterium]